MKRFVLSVVCLLCCLSGLCQQRLEQGKQYYKWGDYAHALPLLQQAAKEGYGEACYLLGNMYYDGNGAEQDYAMAMRMYQRGLEFGYNQGNAELGRMYEDGDGCEKDLRKAFSYYSKSNANGEKLGMYLLGRCYMYAIGTEAEGEQAVALFTALYKDSGFKSEYEWAYRWTCYFLGLCYEIGFGAQRDLDQTVSYYIMSENPDALFHASRLVKLYSLWKKDWKSLLKSAVWKGNRDGQVLYEYVKLALAERKGAIDAQTFGYLEQAAETYPPALKLLGDCYRLGHGTSVNLIKAREYYDKAEANREAIEQIEEKERQEIERIAEEKRQ